MNSEVTLIADAPTRLQSVTELLESMGTHSGSAARAPSTPCPRATARQRVFLLAAIVFSFALGIGARSFAGPRTARDPPSPICAALPTLERPAAEPPALVAARAAPSGSAAAPAQARTAADAFATGDYTSALSMYEALAAQQPTNPAYVHAARVLRSWVAPAAHPPN
jgi:hypothetical protein